MLRRLFSGTAVLLVTAIMAPTTALAHHPVCRCRMENAVTVVCTGGFSDGSGAPGVVIDVIADDGAVLVPGRLGADSTVRFRRPDQPFYVLLDAGPGHTVEIDHTAIR